MITINTASVDGSLSEATYTAANDNFAARNLYQAAEGRRRCKELIGEFFQSSYQDVAGLSHFSFRQSTDDSLPKLMRNFHSSTYSSRENQLLISTSAESFLRIELSDCSANTSTRLGLCPKSTSFLQTTDYRFPS